MPTLVVDHDGRRREVTLASPVFTIGRDAACSLVVDHSSVSRTHCQLVRRGDEYDLEDLGSSAGTRLDGQKVTRAPVRLGQTIQVGPARITLRDPAAPVPELDATLPMGTAALPSAGWALYAVSGPRTGTALCFAGRIAIGRAPDCDVILDGTEVSTRHAELVPEGTGIALRDLGSTNGSRLDGRPVREARLTGGELLELGPHGFVVDRYPLPARRGGALTGRVVELALVAAIVLLLWGLVARLVVRPLFDTHRAASDPNAIAFLPLDTNQLPRHYTWQMTGTWELNVLLAEGRLRVVGTATPHHELRAILSDALPAAGGWRVRGSIEAVQGPVEIALVGYYRNAAGDILAEHYSGALTLPAGQRQAVEMLLPPLDGAVWVQPGYFLRGPIREARLGALSPEPMSQPALTLGRVRGSGIEAVLSQGGAVELADIAQADFAVMKDDGEILTSLRQLVATGPAQIERGFALASQQIGLGGAREPFALEMVAQPSGVAARLKGGQATHVRWTWLHEPARAELFYQGTPREPNELRPLADEIAVAFSDGREFTIRFAPPVYVEARRADAHGRGQWQLRFAERTLPVLVECQSGNRQRERELVRARLQFERELAADNLADALRTLARWRALDNTGRAPERAAAQQRVEDQVGAVVAKAIADTGPDSRARLLTLLTAYRGTAYVDTLEAELVRRLIEGGDAAERAERSRWLLSEGRFLAAYGHYHLARIALQMLVEMDPTSPEATKAQDLVRLLPA